MNKILIIIFTLTAILSFSKEALKEWSYYKEIKTEGTGKYKYFFLDNDIYRYSNNQLSDLRIIDNLGKPVSYYIIEGFKEETKDRMNYDNILIKNYNEKIKNSNKIDSIYEFQILYEKDDLFINNIEITTENKSSYSVQIEIFGRSGKSDWGIITKDTIYKIDNFKKNTVELNKSFKNKFCMIKILDNNSNFKISGITPYQNRLEKKYENYKENAKLKFEIENEKEISFINIENSDRLKLQDLIISAEGNYNREYGLFRKDDEYSFNSGNIYNFKHNNIDISKNKININRHNMRDEEFILKIYNKSNLPLKITDIKTDYIIDKIVFEDVGSKTYKIYFGNTEALSPKYDIESFKNYIENDEIDKCSLGMLTQNKDISVEKKGFNYKIIFNIVILLTSIFLIFILLIKLKKK